MLGRLFHFFWQSLLLLLLQVPVPTAVLAINTEARRKHRMPHQLRQSQEIQARLVPVAAGAGGLPIPTVIDLGPLVILSQATVVRWLLHGEAYYPRSFLFFVSAGPTVLSSSVKLAYSLSNVIPKSFYHQQTHVCLPILPNPLTEYHRYPGVHSLHNTSPSRSSTTTSVLLLDSGILRDGHVMS